MKIEFSLIEFQLAIFVKHDWNLILLEDHFLNGRICDDLWTSEVGVVLPGPMRQCSFWAILRFNVFIGVKCFLCCVSVMRKWSALVRVILKLIFTAMLTIMWFWAAPTSSTMENVCRGAAHVSSLFFFCGATFEISYKTCDSSFSTLHWTIFGRSIAEY